MAPSLRTLFSTPSPDAIEASNEHQFCQHVNKKVGSSPSERRTMLMPDGLAARAQLEELLGAARMERQRAQLVLGGRLVSRIRLREVH